MNICDRGRLHLYAATCNARCIQGATFDRVFSSTNLALLSKCIYHASRQQIKACSIELPNQGGLVKPGHHIIWRTRETKDAGTGYTMATFSRSG